MRRLKLPIDTWFERFRALSQHEGYLPDFGVSSVSLPNMATFNPKTADQQDFKELNCAIFNEPQYHFLTAVAVCFWSGVTCWKCNGFFTAHSLVAKAGSMACKYTIRTAAFPVGEKTLLLEPLIQLDTRGTDLYMMLFGAEHIDKMVLNTWRRTAFEMAVAKLLPDVIAESTHSFSNAYGTNYWALHCPHCTALQGDNFLKPRIEVDGTLAETAPLSKTPDLMVVPMMQDRPTLGGLVLSRILVRSAA